MNSLLNYALYSLVGAIIGLFYFVSLWITIKSVPGASKPVLLTFGSYFGRMIAVLLVFYLIARSGRWEYLVLALAGFIVSRYLVINRIKGWKRYDMVRNYEKANDGINS